MYCTCSNGNNYEVISLCNIKNFTNKNGPFINSAWTQISLADILTLPYNCPKIEKIEKIYIEVNITSNKIIKTPKSPGANAEGLVLTGKKLLIDGYFCIKLVYTSLTKEQSIHSINFNIPFCTYIVIEENADLFIDSYCVKTCVEDIFASLLNCNTIFFNVTLFLFASKVTPTCAMPQPPKDDCTIIVRPTPRPLPPPPAPKPNQLPNAIILYSFDTAEEVVKVEFDTNNNRLIATSTGKLYNKGGNLQVLNFFLNQGNTNNVLASGFVLGNEDGTKFAAALNNAQFTNGDTVYLTFIDPSQVTVTNLPQIGENYAMLDKNVQSFKITNTGLVENIFPQVITLKDNSNMPVVIIKFDILAKKVLVKSTGNLANPNRNGEDYFVVTLLASDNSTVKRTGKVLGGQNAFALQQSFFGRSFTPGDILKLDYLENTKVEVSNFPNVGTATFNPTGTSKSFRITADALINI